MATVSGIITLNTDKLWLECQQWAEFETYREEAYTFINEQLYPLISKWNTVIALTDYFPTTVSGTDEAWLLYQTMENYRGGYNIHDAYAIATGERTIDTA